MIDSPFHNTDKRVTDSFWCGYIGIVKVLDEITGEYKYYIGQGRGDNQHEDEQHIANNGSPIHPQALVRFFNQ